MNPKVEAYLTDGCGRCDLYATPECKVNRWSAELKLLRSIVLDCGLTEEFKWKQPCYTWGNANILILTAFKDFAALAFFKGALLQDNKSILVKPGENSQASRRLRFTDIHKIRNLEPVIKAYIFEAIELEKEGLKIKYKKEPEPFPEELLDAFQEITGLKSAFSALTPGRQRGYLIYFSQPKQSKTRDSRIKKYVEHILNNKGIHDR